MTDLEDIKGRLDTREDLDLDGKLDLILDTMVSILGAVTVVKEQVTPTLETLTRHPLFRMIGGK